MQAAVADETSPAAGHRQCTTETGLVQGPSPEAPYRTDVGVDLEADDTTN